MSSYSDAFNIALAHVLEFEGGYSNHKDDPGGHTFRGVTLKTLRRAWNNNNLTVRDLRALTVDQVAKIYHDMYWLPVKGDDLPAGLNTQVFDAAVNSGPANAIRALQEVLVKRAAMRMPVDGIMGRKTLAGSAAMAPARLIRSYAARRMVFYGLLKTFRMFGFGWAERLMAGLSLAQALIGVLQTPAASTSTEEGKSP